jgi:hypothetical protein
MLTGESQLHISTPLGFELGSLTVGSKQVGHWTSETWCECSEIAGSPQGSPPAADSVGCEAGRKTCSKLETRTEELCEIKSAFHIVNTEPSEAPTEGQRSRGLFTLSARSLVKHPLKGFHISTPLGFEPGSLMVGSKQGGSPQDQ